MWRSSIAVNVRGAELAAVRDLLIATSKREASTLLLVDILRRPHSGAAGTQAPPASDDAKASARSRSWFLATLSSVAFGNSSTT